MRPRAETVRQRALRLIGEGRHTNEVAALLGVPYGTVREWRQKAGLVGRQGNWKRNGQIDVTHAHRLVLAAVRLGDRCAAEVALRVPGDPVDVERLAYDLVRWGLLRGLDGEPWCLTESGVQVLLDAPAFARWRERTPVRGRRRAS